jgi:signal transduction histidine kinase
MPPTAWFSQQLVGFLEVVWSAPTETAAAWMAVERAAEALDAEVAAIMSGGRPVAAVGYPEGAEPLAELNRLATGGPAGELTVPGAGPSPAASVAMHYPPGAAFIVARAGADGGLGHDEASLLQGMARVTSMAMRTQRLLDDERAAREESDRQATENARLLTELTQRQDQLTDLADEQAALRRVATLVAAQAAPGRIFAAVAEEVGRLLRADVSGISMFDVDQCETLMAAWSRTGSHVLLPIESPFKIEDDSLAALVLRSGRPARFDNYGGISDRVEMLRKDLGIRSAIGAPIVVGGRVWGSMSVASTQPEPLPLGAEQRLADFTELLATAISNAQARREVTRLADEQAALRRVAMLVATGVPPEEVFDAVIIELRLLLDAGIATLLHYEADGTATVVAASAEPGAETPLPGRLTLDGVSVAAAVRNSGRTARIDGFDGPPGSIAATYRALGMHSATAAPIIVEGSLWGAMVADWKDRQSVPADTEGRIAQFTELVATAISNTASRAQLAASRARIVATADETRRRIERNLHDGIQQRLVTLTLELRGLQDAVAPADDGLLASLAQAGDELVSILDELREISRGVHPAVLSQGGLGPALRSLARRTSLPVVLDIRGIGRLPQPVEAAAYYVVSEALTNAVKHANATAVQVQLTANDGWLHLSIGDDGDGGADPAQGTGIIGLIDRVDAMGGKLRLRSPYGQGTSLTIGLPVAPGA